MEKSSEKYFSRFPRFPRTASFRLHHHCMKFSLKYEKVVSIKCKVVISKHARVQVRVVYEMKIRFAT